VVKNSEYPGMQLSYRQNLMLSRSHAIMTAIT